MTILTMPYSKWGPITAVEAVQVALNAGSVINDYPVIFVLVSDGEKDGYRNESFALVYHPNPGKSPALLETVQYMAALYGHAEAWSYKP